VAHQTVILASSAAAEEAEEAVEAAVEVLEAQKGWNLDL
jgi:hypothetical protein